MYALLGGTFGPPREAIHPVRAAASGMGRANNATRSLAFHQSWEAFRSSLLAASEFELSALQDVYLSSFETREAPVSLRESGYLVPDPAVREDVVADVRHAYTSAGLRHAGSMPPDHLVVELSFLSFLCGKEAEGWETQQRELVRGALRREQEFLDHHLCRWLPLLVGRLNRDARSDLYSRAASAAWALASHDRDMASLLGAQLREEEDVR